MKGKKLVTVQQIASTPYIAVYWRARPWRWKMEDEIWDKPRMNKVKKFRIDVRSRDEVNYV